MDLFMNGTFEKANMSKVQDNIYVQDSAKVSLHHLPENLICSKPHKNNFCPFLREANSTEQSNSEVANILKQKVDEKIDNPFDLNIEKQFKDLVVGNEKDNEENVSKFLTDNPKLEEILSNASLALQNNEKLRNLFLEKQKQMGWNILPTNEDLFCDATSTDLGLIKLNEKIKIHQSGNTTDTINILMFGKSGCGQTTLLSYLTDNNQLIGTDSMSTQQFSSETFQLPSGTGMTNIRINESPGMCSGLEIQQLEEHWNHLISRVNKEGGVNVFLLLIKSNERITLQFIDELEEFSELYFEKREELWKRTVVVFTSIDELKGCNTLEDRVHKMESQMSKPGMEKVKTILDQTICKCIYVSCKTTQGKEHLVNELQVRMHSIDPNPRQNFGQHVPNRELKQISIEKKCNVQETAHEKPLEPPQEHHLCKNTQDIIHQKHNSIMQSDLHSTFISKPKHAVNATTSEKRMQNKPSNTHDQLLVDEATIMERKRSHLDSFCSEEVDKVDPQKILQQMSKEKIIALCVETCKDKRFEDTFIETYIKKFSDTTTRQVKSPKKQATTKPKKRKKK